MPKTFYILDGYYQIYRAFYAPFRELTSPSGEPTRATYVFFQMLLGLVRQRRPDYLAMALDAGDETTFRRALDENYKANRDPAPEALHVQADRIASIMAKLGIQTYCLPGYEADDLMATMTERLKHDDVDLYLVSRDKDLEQLMTPRVHLYDASKDEVIDSKTLFEKKGYTPEQAVEIQTLAGDSTDNIPGVPGIGTKTAAKLIREYGSAEAVLKNAARLTPKQRERVIAFADQLPLTRKLVTLRRDVPMDFSLDDCPADNLNFTALRPIFNELGFNRLKEQLDLLTAEPRAIRAATFRSRDVTALASQRRPAPAARQEYHLIDTPKKFDSFIEKLGSQPSFAFDTETNGLNPVAADLVGLSFSWKAGEAYYIPVRAVVGTTLPVETVVDKLRPILEDESIGKVGQNLKYDILVLRQVGVTVAGLVFDTMIASFLLDPLARSHSLDSLAKQHFDHEMIPITDLIGKGKNQITLEQVDTSRVCQYAAEDADLTWRLYEVLSSQMAGSDVERLFRDTEMPLIQVLAEMEHNGISLDSKLLGELSKTMTERMDELRLEVHQAAGHEFNIDSTKQLATVLFDEQGLSPIRKTKTGQSTDAETLATLAERTQNPIPSLVLAYRELAKLKNTYVDTLPKMVCPRTGRVHASFDQTGAVTGRLSSSRPNLQNIPIRTEAGRRIRAAIVTGDSTSLLLTADYSQIELRILAHYSEDGVLLEAFRAGKDIHRSVAADVHGISMEEVTASQRSAAKAISFGIIYGQSAYGLARSLGISLPQAKAFIDAYFERYPRIRSFIKHCVEQARQQGYAQTALGRRRPIQELHSRNRQQVALGERLAVNTVIQGSAADLIKRAMVDIHHSFRRGDLAAKMLIQVHDELVFEVSESEVESAAEVIRGKMEHAMPLNVPLVVDIAWGRNWAGAK